VPRAAGPGWPGVSRRAMLGASTVLVGCESPDKPLFEEPDEPDVLEPSGDPSRRLRGSRRGEPDARRRPPVREGGVLPSVVRRRLPGPLDDPGRAAGARPRDVRRRSDSGAGGGRGPEPGPGHARHRRSRVHLPLAAQAPGAHAAPGVARPLARGHRPGPGVRHAPRRGGHPRATGPGGGDTHHEPTPRRDAGLSRARRLPGSLRGPDRHDRRVRSPGREREPRHRGSDGDHLDGGPHGRAG
jgi:hypothetical protein